MNDAKKIDDNLSDLDDFPSHDEMRKVVGAFVEIVERQLVSPRQFFREESGALVDRCCDTFNLPTSFAKALLRHSVREILVGILEAKKYV